MLKMNPINSEQTQDRKPSITNLLEIKKYLEDSDSNSIISVTDSSASTESTESKQSNKKSKKSKKSTNKYKTRQLESRIHYMKLDMVNKDILIEKLQAELTTLNKNEILFKNITFLFDRLDNAYLILNEKFTNCPENNFHKQIYYYETVLNLCYKTQNKYKHYLLTSVSNHSHSYVYINEAVYALYDLKNNKLFKISEDIIQKINIIKYYHYRFYAKIVCLICLLIFFILCLI